ncbi:hypothetical protein [Streptomyces sp. NPDC059009]|uniref:hypothetical protein n=1 Tax=Streptomyces sp. NPDC059009 TaxID=3346694 RepID=UPI00367C1DB9
MTITHEARLRGTPAQTVHEAYAFTCLSCGHSWEQRYDIRHYRDGAGIHRVQCTANGEPIASPLTRPVCKKCEGTVVRILRAGTVASAHAAEDHHRVKALHTGLGHNLLGLLTGLS